MKQMPSISKIRLTNVVYEEGNKRYNDELFLFDGHNAAMLLENGGGKTVFIQTAIQAILPHVDLAERKIKNTLLLENAPAHIAIEWITNDKPRRYVVTAVSLFTTKHGLDSLRYVYEYDANDPNGIEGIPFVREGNGRKRTAERGEMNDYYSHMRDRTFSARTFTTIKDYKTFLEEQYHIISSEWDSIVKINSTEGGVEAFFDDCKSTNQLFDRLLIPTVESSIVGYHATIFADLFEQQHTSFKNYKKLKETIEENKQIQLQLEDYVHTYEKLHERELDYLKSKEKAKATWNEILHQMEKITTEKTNTMDKLEQWKSSYHTYQMKSASYDIFVEETEYKRLKREYEESLIRKNDIEERLHQQNKAYYSLKLAEIKLDLKQQNERLTYIDKELAKFDELEEVEDFTDQLEEAKRTLLGWYMEKIEKLEKDKDDIQYQLNPILAQIEQAEGKNAELSKKENKLQQDLSKMTGFIESRQKDMEKLKQQILSNPDQENVKEELDKWQSRVQFLDEEIIHLIQKEKLLFQKEKEAGQRKDMLQNEFFETETLRNKISYKLSAMEKDQEDVIQQLALLRPQWTTLDNIYLKQESIEKRIIDTLQKLGKEKDSFLHRERIAYRFVDDHEEQETFFGDAFLEQQLSSWKNQFDYLITGVEYVKSLGTAEKERLNGYSLWPITLITTNKSKGKVLEKLKHVSDQLQFPITILTPEEALALDEGGKTWISPSHWDSNMDEATFAEWKQQIGSRATEMTKLRKDKEQEIKEWEDGLKVFNQFIKAHPYEEITKLSEEHRKLKNKLEELTLSIQKEKHFMKQQRGKIDQNKQAIVQSRQEMQGLEWKIEKGVQFVQFEKEIDEGRRKQKDTNDALERVHREIGAIHQQMLDFKDEKDHLKTRVNNIEVELGIHKQDDEYTALQSLSPLFTKEGKTTIKEKIFNLEMKIREINVAQGEWVAKKDAAFQTINRLNNQVTELLQEHSDVNENMEFPSDGKQLLQSIWNQIGLLKGDVDQGAKEAQSKMSLMDEQKGKWHTKIDQFKKQFPNDEIEAFTQSLDEVAEQLDAENKKLEDRKKYLDQQLVSIEKELKSVEKAQHGLELFEEGHHFNAPDIIVHSLSQDEVLTFTYNRSGFVIAITDELKANKSLVEVEQKEVEKAKRKFREFCLDQISDIKLQKMAINGVENKLNYEDIRVFKTNMLTRIEKISHYANEHIRQSDEDLQLFINQIHSHLLTLVEELKQIPKKTRVKVEDDWKQVFSFSIPEWEEEVGKMRIRDYIEWILNQLESEKYVNEQGMQDDGKVRKEIEVWLQSKQLLQMIMNNDVMKVSCRKVTNDNKVSTRSYSWEQSNVWSGGEKWSKNMTLFLGILNYVAEKKKHIQPNMKRHRAVILDNPFGKASSDHVLSPVFYIAEQLGFQMIALTAHAEGKFLQDYFPVIYSCRLRTSTDPNKKVMTKEKWLHHAYFQDHEPDTIERLGETEQLGLF